MFVSKCQMAELVEVAAEEDEAHPDIPGMFFERHLFTIQLFKDHLIRAHFLEGLL